VKHIADRFVVLLDANVLYPFRKRDILLRFYHAGLFQARWSEDILAEWTHSLLSMRPELSTSINSQLAAMREVFPEALVTGYESLVGGLTLPDPDDRHVLAAAIQCGAQHIVTDNLADFPKAALDHFSIEAIDADEFLSRTFDLYPVEALEILRTTRKSYKNPPFTPSEFVFDLTAKGLPKLASRLRPNRAIL
jgi:hypothetical protein